MKPSEEKSMNPFNRQFINYKARTRQKPGHDAPMVMTESVAEILEDSRREQALIQEAIDLPQELMEKGMV